jgi:hypothetical protein
VSGVDLRRLVGDAWPVRLRETLPALWRRGDRARWCQILFACGCFVVSGCSLFTAEESLWRSRDSRIEQDFGRVAAGAILEASFVIGNPTAAPLGLALGAASCACEVEIHETAVVAGGRTEVNLRVDTTALAGAVVRIVELETTDELRPKLHLVLRGTVVPPVRAQPPVLYFGRVAAGARAQKQIVLTPGGPEIRIRRVSSASGRLGLRRVAAPPGDVGGGEGSPLGRVMVLEVFLPANLRAGGHEDQLLVETSSSILPRYEIPVLAIVER